MFCQGPRYFGGLSHKQKEESQLKVILTAEGLQFQELMQMSTESLDLVHADHWLTVRMIGTELNLSLTSVHQILTSELGMRKV